MNEALSAWIDPLVRGDLGLDALARLGEPEPATGRAALLAAAQLPDLAPHLEHWAPALLTSARPGSGARAMCEIAERYQQTRRCALPPACLPALARVAGSSDFLARLLRRHAHWVEHLVGDPPDPPNGGPIDPDWTSIRIAKYQGLLRIAARDLLGRPFEASLAELSELADRCLRAGWRRSATECGVSDEPALFALGKLGGGELNFSSDVDLLVLYHARDVREDLAKNELVARLVQNFKRNLEVPSEDGFGYRVDLDLRPEGRSGTLANSVDAALGYYETFGAEWERQALIRLRHIAGPSDIAQQFQREIEPFVFRRGIDPRAIQKVGEMKLRIEQDRRRANHDIDRNLKEGPGGIRDVEFFVQALQLLYGGRHREIRTGNVLHALLQLEERGLIAADVAAELRNGYLWLRRAEHALQLAEERRTHQLPADALGQTALARRMGYDDEDAGKARARLLDDASRVRTAVREQFDALVLEGGHA